MNQIMFLFLMVELYLQDTARNEIQHRNKKPIERKSFNTVCSFELFKYSFVVRSATIINHI